MRPGAAVLGFALLTFPGRWPGQPTLRRRVVLAHLV